MGKQYCHSLNQHPRICVISKFLLKKSLNVGPKLLKLGIFKLEFQNNIILFQITALKFV